MTVRAGTNWGWRNYWKENRNASCVPENPATAQEIDARWLRFFSELADGSRILDVATGNGVLLAHAATAAERAGKNFLLTGIDLADINPVRYVSNLPEGLGQAKFIGRVAAEKLPFSDACFDVVVSQYGLEYAGLEAALAEVERVLVAGGQLHWLAHSRESTIVAQNQDQSKQVDFLLSPDSPMQAMRLLIAKIKKHRNVGHSMSTLSTSLRKAEDYCRDNPPAAVVREVCTEITQIAQRWQAYYPNDLVKMLDDSKQQLMAHRQRINDLRASVMTSDREEVVRKKLRASHWQGLSLVTLRVGSASSPIGTIISARRAKSDVYYGEFGVCPVIQSCDVREKTRTTLAISQTGPDGRVPVQRETRNSGHRESADRLLPCLHFHRRLLPLLVSAK